MVTPRGKGRGGADQKKGTRRQLEPSRRKPGRTSRKTPGRGRLPPEECPLSNGVNSEDDEQTQADSETQDEEDVKPARTIIRKSRRLQRTAGGRRNGLRRSSRRTKLTSRYQAANMCDGLSTKKTMDGVKSKRRLSNGKEGKLFCFDCLTMWFRVMKLQKIYSKAQRRTPDSELSDSEEEDGANEDSRQEGATDDDSNSSANEDAKASSFYRQPSSTQARVVVLDFPRGTFRISASGPNTSRRGKLRPTKSAWLNRSDDDDSDDEDEISENTCRSFRPVDLRTDNLLGTRKMNAGAGLADIDPMAIDQSVGFDSIGGLSGHISALKEMVVFPLLYPEVFDNFKIQPPRGCLFYGPPGTGKTLVARALASECSHGNRKVSFFMRKGADCLSKWVGESERQLRLLFEQAYQLRPSIIFFDEIDGLAPVRSSRQDQIHSSIVSTLLALMDGLDNRGEVVVIGATNRLDSIDPALRRPGRFDREFLFGLPDREVSYCGADIRAVCTEAALCALRRRYPQIYGTSEKLLLDVSSIAVSSCDFVAAMRKMSPAGQRSAASPAKPLSSIVHPLLGAALRDILEALQRLFPHAEQGMKRKREPDLTSGILDDGLMYGGEECPSTSTPSISTPSTAKNFLHFARSAVKHPTSYRPRMLLAGRPGAGQTSHLAPAVLHALERFTVYSLDSAVLFGVSSTCPEEACTQVFCEARRTSPSILYIPHLQQWWETAGSALRASFFSLLDSIPSFSPILLLATCNVPPAELDPEIQCLFREEYGEVYNVSVPTRQERIDFFQDLILKQAAEAPPSRKKALAQSPEILPVAPLPPSNQLSEQEEDVLRELRLFLRNVTGRLILDRRFKAFTKPVDIEEVPDYLMVIKKPMDLSTLLTNINKHKYVTVSEFLADADLIWQNALEYNPDNDPMDRHIRQRACALKDTIRAIIRDELDGDFERVCEEIKESRRRRDSSSSVKMRPMNGSAYPSLSSTSESSDGEQGQQRVNGVRGIQNGVLVNGYHHPGSPQRRLPGRLNFRDQIQIRNLVIRVNRIDLNTLDKLKKQDKRNNKAAMEQLQLFNTSVKVPDREMPPLVVDHRKLRALLNQAVDRTEGTEVEPLEKLYALLAQCIYRHRNNHNKTELLKVRRPEAELCFLWPPDVCHTSCLCDSTCPFDFFVFGSLVS
ncbi:hypothetical protein INR49_014676 [Caranx melampygus]|nr:hypothetical protein INR49_014676 [Caranx melampygus]